jgi:hypothetical protein
LWFVSAIVGVVAVVFLGSPLRAQSSVTSPSESWVKFSADTFNQYSPDTNALYYTTAYVTADGVRTVIEGRAPQARYWSFTAYRTESRPVASVYDAEVPLSAGGRYRLVLSASCAGVAGTCLATSGNAAGFLVYRLYVPDDLGGAQTGEVPLPTVGYANSHGSTDVELTALDLPPAAQQAVDSVEHVIGQSVITGVGADPFQDPATAKGAPQTTVRAGGAGPFSNPDNIYLHMRYTTADGDLVITGMAPTYRAQSPTPANHLGRRRGAEQVRYWSLCTEVKDGVTVACLRDEQVVIPAGSHRFVIVVAPACPVAGYRNCLPAGLQPIQVGLLYRNLLPAAGFEPFTGAYRPVGRYVDRG